MPVPARGEGAEPAQIAPDRLDEPLLAALGIGIVDPKHEAPAVLPRPQPVVERGADVTDMQLPGGRRRETRGDGNGAALAPGRAAALHPFRFRYCRLDRKSVV